MRSNLSRRAAITAAIFLGFAGAVAADAPQPAQSVDLSRFAGRWYEIARTPNRGQPACLQLAVEVTRPADGRFSVTNTCRRAEGQPRVVRANGTVIDARSNAKIRLTAAGVLGFGGLASQEYWILDRAADYNWAILGTPGGNYFWVWSRQAEPSAAARAALISRVRTLGYNTSNIVHTGR